MKHYHLTLSIIVLHYRPLETLLHAPSCVLPFDTKLSPSNEVFRMQNLRIEYQVYVHNTF